MFVSTWSADHHGNVTAEHPPVDMAGDRVVVRRYSLADADRLHEAILHSVEHLAP